MKKLLNILAITLALNFLAAAGGIAWLMHSGKLDQAKIQAIREMIFTSPAVEEADDSSVPPVDPATQPTLRLEELLARQSGRTATEQVEFIQRTFDAQMAQLDRRQRELHDLQRSVDLSRQQLTRDREAMEQERDALRDREALAERLENDQGFQDSLELYRSMAGKQVKSIFMQLEDETIIRYFQSMEPREARKIIKEFKTPEELHRIQRVLEKMRDARASIDEE